MDTVTQWTVLKPYDEYEIEHAPMSACYYGEIPPAFIAFAKEKTGLEGYELRDYVDLLILDIFDGWDFANWVRIQQEIVAAAKKRMSTFRTWLAIGMAALIALPAIVGAVQAAITAVTTSSSIVLSALGKVKLFAEVFVGSLELSFKVFLTIIHFDTLVGAHKIALLVSDDYRNVMRQVYGEITKVSEALGYGPYFLTLALQNTRNLVLDVSTSMGMRYDLAEVSWLSTFQGYLKNFAGATYRYANNPEALFFDLSRWVEKDALDKKGAFIEGLVKTIEKTTETVAGAIESVIVIRDDLTKLVVDLPDRIRLQIEPAIMPYIEKFDTFIYDTYDPYKKELDGIIDTIKSLQSTQRSKMTDLADRLKRPADYMLEIDTFTDEDRMDQEIKFDDLSSRHYKRQITDIDKAVAPINMEMKRISEIITRPLELMFMGVEELTAPVPGPIGEIDPSKTWFVGDF